MNPNNVSLLDVKQALRDERFRASLPDGMKEDVEKYLKNPSCACNVPFYRKLLRECRTQLQEYFPGKIAVDPIKETSKVAENHFSVINCRAEDLESELRKLPPGRKQLAVARSGDDVTVIVNELDVSF